MLATSPRGRAASGDPRADRRRFSNLCDPYGDEPSSTSTVYLAAMHIVLAVHTPDRDTVSALMAISPNNRIEPPFRRIASDLRFVVGQDRQGRWIAVEDLGRGGGIFVSRQAALQYVASETGQPPKSVHFTNERLCFRS
jgi:hypothetical protein